MTKLFINDWRSYNEGDWIADEWMTPSQVLDFLDEHEEEGREWFVADCESVEGFCIPESCNLYAVCEALVEIELMGAFEQRCAAALFENGESLEDVPYMLDRFIFYDSIEDYYDACDEVLELPEDSVLSRYFDYDAYHRDCDFDIIEASNGICFL